MVDFQSRTTRRGTDDVDEDEPAEQVDEGGNETAETAAEEETMEDEQSPPAIDGLGYAVVSVSAQRTVETDPAGTAIVEAIEAAGDTVVTREVLAPSYDGVQSRIGGLVDRRDVDAVVTTGGTGLEPDDFTIEAVDSLFDKEMPGFGELYRLLCHDDSGTAIVRTRATAGLVGSVPVFCLAGNESMARLGTAEIVVEEAETIASQARPE